MWRTLVALNCTTLVQLEPASAIRCVPRPSLPVASHLPQCCAMSYRSAIVCATVVSKYRILIIEVFRQGLTCPWRSMVFYFVNIKSLHFVLCSG